MHGLAALLVAPLLVSVSSAAQVLFNTYGPGDCNSEPNTRFVGANGGGNTCHRFNAVSYGAQYEVTSGATCVFKSWQNADCSGLATVRTITGAATNCIPIANTASGEFHVPAGLQSVSITCS